MGLFLVCFLVGWFLTPYFVGAFWLFIAGMPFVAIYNGKSANLILILFCLSALLIQNEFRFLYVIGAVATIMFMVLSSVAVAAFNYVVSHPGQIAIAAAGVLAIFLFFIPRTRFVVVNEQQSYENAQQQLALSYDPAFGFAKEPRLIEQEVVTSRPPHSSPKLRTRMFGVFTRLRRQFSRPLRAGDVVECVMPIGDLAAGLYTVRSRDNGIVRVWGLDGGWEIRRFRRWTVR